MIVERSRVVRDVKTCVWVSLCPGYFPLREPGTSSPGLASVREDQQHHQAVQVELQQSVIELHEHGSPQLDVCRVHRRLHNKHLCHGHHV